MRGWRRSVAALIGVGAVLAVSAGCAPKVASTGQKLADPSAALSTALAKLKKDNYAGIQNNSITVSNSTACFYAKAGKDAKGVSDQAVCGPIRRLGLSDAQVWDRYQLSFTSNSDGDAVATVGDHTAQGVAVDTSLLVSASDVKPAAVSDVPAPRAPQTSVTNRAVAVADNAQPAGLAFSKPDKPVTVITPSAKVSVIGVAQPKDVPDALVAGQHDPAGQAAYYLPATGQKLYAYQLQISAPPSSSVPAATSGSTTTPDLSTGLALRSGSTDIAISDQTGASGASSTLAVPCAASGSAAYPCEPRTTRITVLATVPASGTVSLVSKSAGASQAVDLASGAVTGSVSSVEYQRTKLTTKINKSVKTDTYHARINVPGTTPGASPGASSTPTSTPTPSSTATSTPSPTSTPSGDPKGQQTPPAKPKVITADGRWSLTVDSVGITGYDPALGWAPSGQAWVILKTSDYTQKTKGATFGLNRPASLSLTVDNTVHPVKSPTEADLTAHPATDITWAFEVPADATAAILTFRPTGTVSAHGVSADFASDQPATLQFDLPH
ncbi:hypothetical protein GCM10011575_39480 [Microlunatus endophyticus]|uniref:Uncharacterized protein n=1 Tax=Microlunatus endophyticus TaxID=1716077 RepID=A0A917W8L2_9ACTN|nr:hypothetical protein GCM10011575_39480 [Microlunatus endophyticus]